MARRWDVEEKRRAPTGAARSFTDLLARGLVGISDQVLRDHLTLYQNACAELAMLDQARPLPWQQPAALPSLELQALLASPVRDLDLTIEGQLAEAIAQVEAELQSRGIVWRPHWYLGDGDFWTTDQATSINLPWYLANDKVWALVNDQDTRYTREDVVQILRHEVGHALGYAFEIWKDGLWKVTFGDFFQAYVDTYTPDPTSTDYVRHLHEMPSSPNAHYAQKHPDEDWAESFAVWLDPGSRWRETYAAWPGALKKLEAVQTLLVDWGRAYGPDMNRRIGRTIPYTDLAYTVADYLGVHTGPDPYEALLRRAPEVYSSIVLHELYFEGLARGASEGMAPSGRFEELATAAFGSVPAWGYDFRAAARASSGWVLTVWDRRDSRIRNVLIEGHARGVPPNADVLIALDLFEHAYVGDVGIRKDVYVGAWSRNINWAVVDMRTCAASPPPAPETLPVLVPPDLALATAGGVVSGPIVTAPPPESIAGVARTVPT